MHVRLGKIQQAAGWVSSGSLYMKRIEQQNREARPHSRAGLPLLLCLCLILAILLSQTADYLLSLRTEAIAVTAQITRSLPVPAEREADDGKMNVNTASAADFQRAEGIGPKLAQAIVDARDSRGGFFFLEELKDVLGIGDKRFEALKKLFYCPME